ncbi:MAG: hypothetical protein JSV80_09610 [Acidobacteriota bacterium]|nr:MAG: hypothetical protein JSV80_09610 [Acidobacteriota bacterium]
MRISQAFTQRLFLEGLERTRTDLQEAMGRMASGRRVRYGSDDPQVVGEIVRLSEQIQQLAARRRSIIFATPWLETTEQAISEVGRSLESALVIAVDGASEDLDQTGRDALADSVLGLRQSLEGLASRRLSGRYMFSGTQTDRPPFDVAGAYQGNGDAIEIHLDGKRLAINVPGDRAFGELGVGGPIEVLDQLEQALRAGDTDAVHALIDPLQSAVGDNSALLAEIGVRRQQLEDADLRLTDLETTLKIQRAELADADIAEALSDVQRLEAQYQATLVAGTRLFGGSFFDYIG